MKKVLAIILAMTLLLSLCACGSKSNGKDGEKEPQISLENLTGTFKYDNGYGYVVYYITFHSDGSFTRKEDLGGAGSFTREGKFEIKDGKIIISEFGSFTGCPIGGDGEYDVKLEGTSLTIGQTTWEYVK